MTAGSTISVLTLVRNRADHLENLVEGLVRSDRIPDELIVVDMSDVPVTLASSPFPNRVIRLECSGLLLAHARNLAAREARGDHLLFLDVDCIPMRVLVGQMGEALSTTDALICAEVRYLAAGDARLGWTESDLVARGRPHPVRSFPLAGLRREANVGLFWSLAFGLRRSRFEAMGGFDERFVGYGAEDTDFGFRARDEGLGLYFMGGAGAFHQHHGVIDPPLQHYDDILRNAQTFHAIWSRWPMTGWLEAFERMGLLHIEADRLVPIRSPTAEEIEAARKAADQPF